MLDEVLKNKGAGVGRREEVDQALVELEERMRNRLVLPKTILSEMRKLSVKTENALSSIDGLLADFMETKKKLQELL